MKPWLDMLKVDLGIMTTNAYDARLSQYLQMAKAQIEREGVTIHQANLADAQLVVMYAAWLWRRRDNMEAMPRMLRYLLNNRVFSEAAATEATSDGFCN